MSKRLLSASNLALSGIRILVGRARHQAGTLSAGLRRLGAEVIEIPFIEIRKPKSFKPLDAALRNLGTYDWLILTSVNGVEALWARMESIRVGRSREGRDFSYALKRAIGKTSLGAQSRQLRIAAIGPATRRAIEQRGVRVDVMPREYVAESVVRSLKKKVKGKRVLLVRAKVARDVIPRELRKAGAQVDVVEAYETVVPKSSRARLRTVLNDPKRQIDIVTFTSSSTVRNFVTLVGKRQPGIACPQFASIGPVTSATLRQLGRTVDIEAKRYTIPGLIDAILAKTKILPSAARSVTP